MVKILNSVKNDIDIKSGLSDNQIYALNQVLQKYSEKNEEAEEPEIDIIDEIEYVVNSLYNDKKIRVIEIKQVNDKENQYEFNNILIKLIFEEKFDRKVLVVDKEFITLEEWLLENFGLQNEDSIKNKTQESNKKFTNKKKTK